MPTRPTLNILTITPNQAAWDATVTTNDQSLATFVSDQPIAPKVYTIAAGASQLPAAANYQYCLAVVSDPAAGKSMVVVSNGVNWLYADASIAL